MYTALYSKMRLSLSNARPAMSCFSKVEALLVNRKQSSIFLLSVCLLILRHPTSWRGDNDKPSRNANLAKQLRVDKIPKVIVFKELSFLQAFWQILLNNLAVLVIRIVLVLFAIAQLLHQPCGSVAEVEWNR